MAMKAILIDAPGDEDCMQLGDTSPPNLEAGQLRIAELMEHRHDPVLFQSELVALLHEIDIGDRSGGLFELLRRAGDDEKSQDETN